MQERTKHINSLVYNGHTYYDLNTLTKSELRSLERLPFGHATLCGDAYYIKINVWNKANPPRLAFSMVLDSDYEDLREKERERENRTVVE